MLEIDKKASRDKRKWLMIMILIMAAIITACVLVSVLGGLQLAPYALIFAIIAVAITAKLCVAQMGKVLERQRNEREKLDTNGSFSNFNFRG